MRLLRALLAAPFAALIPFAVQAKCSHNGGNDWTCPLEIPDFSNVPQRKSPYDEHVSVEQCRNERKGVAVIYKSDAKRAYCVGPQGWEDYNKLSDGTILFRRACTDRNTYNLGEVSWYDLEKPEDALDKDGKPTPRFCQLGVMDADEVRASRRKPTPAPAAAAPTPAPSQPSASLPAPTAPSPTRPAPVPQPVPPPQAPMPGLPPKVELPKLPDPVALPELPKPRLMNPAKPPALLAKAQKQPISQACVAVMESHKVSSMCDFVSGVTMYANDIRIPAQHARDCPSPVEYEYVSPQDGKVSTHFATPRKGIVHSCGAPIVQVRVR